MSGVDGIDEGFYSRQLYVLGCDGMHRMGTASVLIAGMRGLGVEIAKNVILSGVKSVTVQDEGVTDWGDLSSQFFLMESHLGQNRASCSLQQLSLLNPRVQVSAHTGPLAEELLLQFQVVVLTDSLLDDQKRLGDFCHRNGVKFIVADTKGLCGQLFCDFGDEFEVLDQDGEPPASTLIQRVFKDDPGLVICIDDERHKLSDFSKVCFTEVQGMTELNSLGPVEIKVRGPHSFTICDTSNFSDYERGGRVTEVKEPVVLNFKPLSEALLDHQHLTLSDYGKVARHQTLHLAFQALHDFVKRNQRLPLLRCQSDADALLDAVKELNAAAQLDELDDGAVRKLSFTARGDLAPINAFIGGLAAQEVIKACSRKLTPLRQWFYFDALECLPEEEDEEVTLPEADVAAKSTRYDGQIAVFGSAFQEKLKRQKYFLVGAGAIGCELLKNFALMGLGAGEDGHVTVTDMDYIEKSNLNRQFLFRSQDIGQPKSEIAAKAVRELNPAMNITAHQNRLDADSEAVYDSDFFLGLDGVAAALDNVEARVYLDGRCVEHQRPMLEGGTQGSRGHTLVVLPHLTESYEKGTASADGAIPLCTLKNFPHRIEHTLQWARDQFEGLFKQAPESVNLFLREADFVEHTLGHGDVEALEVLEGVWSSLEGPSAGGQRPASWEDCVAWARCKWETLYNNDIRQLLHCLPADKVNDNGLPFWSGSKRCPHPLTFDPSCVLHMDYVVAAANLHAQIFGVEGTADLASVRNLLQGVHVPPFTPKSSVKIQLTDKELEEERSRESGGPEKARLEELKVKLASVPLTDSAKQMCPIDFDKDDDGNFHMDYIVAASNLRAENYDIPAADRLQSKLIAGRIIPAIATTTAAVAGLMCLELYKLVQHHRKISSYRTAYFVLATQNFVWCKPRRAPRFQVAGKEFTQWDHFHVDGRRAGGGQEMTLEDLIRRIKEQHHLTVSELFFGAAQLYSGHEERLKLSVSDVVRTATKADIPAHKTVLELVPSFSEDEDCPTVPFIRYRRL